MKLATLKTGGTEKAAIRGPHGYVLLEALGGGWPTDLLTLLREGKLDELTAWYRGGGEQELAAKPAVAVEEASFGPLYREPSKIWGIGMNYVIEESELALVPPGEEPVGFMKPATTLIGPGESIQVPEGFGEITAEAELAIVIGKSCRGITEAEAPSVVAGFTTALDMTASDIHARNPRFLTRAKSFDTFLSIGPELITVDEVGDVLDLEVATAQDGVVKHTNRIRNMRFRPWYTVAFHAAFMTLMPGDIILTGTPGAVVIRDGDVVECHVNGLQPLVNPVAALPAAAGAVAG
ncbi:fumarylacetoacetate hydrolase family protein [Paenibacillus daejeonensis]|uniref:fumarylacetoacetate hydrolase family protein n=1 Tax=Paenibacillus daejeonensis TaxID=135193 RepID=UPI00035DADCD|nr:fumarylacetoacetate hydrolase family protein [Paenibacillus daejeonensis]